ncbi:MAG: NUDIX domain-containing protein [Planctomycetota bacterium]
MTEDIRQAAGYLVYRNTEEGRQYLLLRNARHGTWGFPKGHRDGDESLECTARRELEEETGLRDPVVDPDFKELTRYEVRTAEGRHIKEVLYLLAEITQGRVEISPEHDEMRWVSLTEARKTLQWDDSRRILMAAHEHLRETTNS